MRNECKMHTVKEMHFQSRDDAGGMCSQVKQEKQSPRKSISERMEEKSWQNRISRRIRPCRM